MATVAMPSFRAVRMTRQAISPRLAIRILLNTNRHPRLAPASMNTASALRQGACSSMPDQVRHDGSGGSLRRFLDRGHVVAEELQDLAGGFDEIGAGAEDRLHAGLAQGVVILGGNDSAD